MAHFQYQIKTEPIFIPPVATVTDIKWYSALSEPVRIKPMLATRLQHYLEAPPAIVVSFGWMESLSEPVRVPLRLSTGSQKFDFPNPFPVIDISWFNSLSSPQKLSKPILPTPSQPFFHFDPIPVVSFGWWEPLAERPWIDLRKGLAAYRQQYQINVNPVPSLPLFNWSYEPLSEPVRLNLRMGLSAYQQQAQVNVNPVPSLPLLTWSYEPLSEPVRIRPYLLTGIQSALFPSLNPIITYTCNINAIETKDAFTLVLYQYAEALGANVGIKEIINSFAMAGILEKNQTSAMVGVVENTSVPASGTPTTQTLFANVGIIEVRP